MAMAITADDVVKWLEELGADVEDGGAGFTYDGEIDISVELSEDETSVLFFAEIGRVAQGATSGELRKILRVDFLGAETNGSALSLAEDNETLALWRSDPLAALEANLLSGLLDEFLAAAMRTRSRLPTDAGGPESEPFTEGSPGGMFRV